MPGSRPGGLSGWLVWRPAGLVPATAPPTFFPCADAHSSRGKKLGCRRPPLHCGPTGAGRPSRRLKTAIEAASGGFEEQSGETTMAQIGSLHPRRRRQLHRHDPHPQHQRQGDHQARRQGQRAQPRLPGRRQRRRVRRGLEQGGQGHRRRVRLGQARRPLLHRRRSTRPWSRARRASTSSSGRADRPAAPRHQRGAAPSRPRDYAERDRAESRGNARLPPRRSA